MRYRQYGESGPVIVLLHGFGGGPMDFKPLIEELEKDHQLIVPNLKFFFSNREPLRFDKQLELLKEFIDCKLQSTTAPFHLMGVSYGGTQSLALRSFMPERILTHALVNPMPLKPLEKLRNPLLKLILSFYYIPGGLNLFFKTAAGFKTLQGLGKVFNMGLMGQRKLKHFNARKVMLIEKALKRFVWVTNHVDLSLIHI